MAQPNNNMPSASIPMPSHVFGNNDAKTMSFDGSGPMFGQSPPAMSMLSESPGRSWHLFRRGSVEQDGAGIPYNPARRDSLKNMWTTQDFASSD